MRFVSEALLLLSWTAAALRVDPIPSQRSPVNQLPISQCGSGWWNAYKKQHDAVMERLSKGQSAADDRFVVYLAREGKWKGPFKELRNNGGMADRMTGIVSLFATALATNATFLIQMEGLHQFYDSPISLFLNDYTELQKAFPIRDANGIKINHQGVWDKLMLNEKNEKDLFSDATNARMLFARVGRGRLNKYFDSVGPIGSRLKETGMQKTAAFKCMFDFLFKPTSWAKSQFAPELALLHPAPFGRDFVDNFRAPLEPQCLMIQIRTGDQVIVNGNQSDSDVSNAEQHSLIKRYQGAFKCAAKKEKEFNREMLWYLMSDSKRLRIAAQQEYGAKKVIAHFGTVDYFGATSNAGMTSVLGEQWLGSLCDGFVVSKDSGLGQQAALRSVAWQRTYGNAPKISYIDADGQGCTDATPEEVMVGWSQM